MIWVAVWAVLLLAAATVFFLLGRDLWRKAKALTRELGTASRPARRDRRPARRPRCGHTATTCPVVRSQSTSRPLSEVTHVP